MRSKRAKSTGSEAATLVDVVERLEGVEDDAEVTHGLERFDLLGVVVVGYSGDRRARHGAATAGAVGPGAAPARRLCSAPGVRSGGARSSTSRSRQGGVDVRRSSPVAPMRWYRVACPRRWCFLCGRRPCERRRRGRPRPRSLVCGLGALFNIGVPRSTARQCSGLLEAPVRPVQLVVWIQIAHTASSGVAVRAPRPGVGGAVVHSWTPAAVGDLSESRWADPHA